MLGLKLNHVSKMDPGEQLTQRVNKHVSKVQHESRS